MGKGDVRIKLPNGATWTLHDVRHIPGLKRNLISVGQLDKEGCMTTFSESCWKVSKGIGSRKEVRNTLYDHEHQKRSSGC